MRETTTTTTTERTPLLYRGGGGGGNSNGDGHHHHHYRPPTARAAAAAAAAAHDHHQHNHNENENNETETTPSYYDDDDCNMKRDRRSMFGRTISLFQRIPQIIFRGSSSASASPPSSGTGGAHPHLQSKTKPSSRQQLLLLNDNNYYEDPTNDESYECCSFGTSENNGIWLNYKDHVGTIMSTLVWVLFLYSGITIVLLAENNNGNGNSSNNGNNHHHHHKFVAALYCTLCALALACHAKTSFTDPGSVPSSALPPMLANQSNEQEIYHTMCSICQTYKPIKAHHCRICNRCICSMDHHCPWMNNCIGIGNLKHFILFLAYTWIACVIALLMFGINYFFCTTDECEFHNNNNDDNNDDSSIIPLIQLVRAMTILCIGTFIFTSSMIVSVVYGIMTGIGTIDRLKRKANNTWHDSIDQPTRLVDIFGIGSYWTWLVPVDPIFQNYDRVMGYSTLQRLLRKEQILLLVEQQQQQQQQQKLDNNNNSKGNIIHNGNENEGLSSWKRRSVLLEGGGGGVGPLPYEPVDV